VTSILPSWAGNNFKRCFFVTTNVSAQARTVALIKEPFFVGGVKIVDDVSIGGGAGAVLICAQHGTKEPA